MAQYYPTQYRPPDQQWQYLKTPHFTFLYSKGEDALALRMGRLMETQYPSVQQLVGGELDNFPVILNSYNDRSNGFVTPLHFRSEIELPPIKGKALNPQTGNWLANVGPHELVHALQFSHIGKRNIPSLVSLFSPDLARAFHGAIPAGMLEGVAVHHETKSITDSGGRGNFPIFTDQFRASFNSNRRWSMGQMMQISTSTRPFNRHYIGGYFFNSWIQQTFGPSTTREALDFYMDFPFLGYGVALRHVTGQWPSQLYDQFERDQEEEEPYDSEPSEGNILPIPFEGREVRRPTWLTEDKLLFYASFYNARPGFYTYNLKSKKTDRLLTTGSVRDYQYDLSEDRSELIYSYFNVDPVYNRTSTAEVVRYSLNSHEKNTLTQNGRVYGPEFNGKELLALQTIPGFSQLVTLPETEHTSNINKLFYWKGVEITAVDVHSPSQKLAVVANWDGNQALWIIHRDSLQQLPGKTPDISFKEGSIFDPYWHPDGDRLLFSSGFSGNHQVYEYHLTLNTVRQVTNAPFGAFEGSYSPDGNKVAFVQQKKNERLPAIISRKYFLGKQITSHSGKKGGIENEPIVPDSVVTDSQNWQKGNYAASGEWLKPRTILPVVEEVTGRDVFQTGLGFYSSDLLQSQSYSTEITYLQQRLWYNFSYRNKTFFPGFRVQLESSPSYLSISNQQQNSTVIQTLLRQQRSLSLSIPIQIRGNQNVFSTSFFIEPKVSQSQLRFFEISPTNRSSNFTNATEGNIYSQFNFRLQQNLRDLQPNTGVILFSELEHIFSADELTFTAYNNSINLLLQQATALHGGIYSFVSPLRKWNQSLRIGLTGLTQSGLLFDNQGLVSEGFSEPVFPTSQNLLSFSTRYTIPLAFVDNGGFLLPLYLSNVYLAAFSNSVVDPTFSNWYQNSRSVFGVELRTRFRLSNLSLDIGVGIGYEPTRQQHQFFIGNL